MRRSRVACADWGEHHVDPLQADQRTDAQLVAAALGAADGAEREATYAAIAGRYERPVLRACARMLRDPDAASDVGQDTFADAFASLNSGKGPANHAALGGWLINIAKNRCLKYVSQLPDVGRLPADLGFDDLPYDDESRSGRATRAAHLSRVISSVVATLEPRDQLTYRLRYELNLSGREIAERLQVGERTGSNEVTKVQRLIAEGVGALILAQEGRPYCRGLARLLDEAAFTGNNFTAALRERIVRHCNVCSTCGATRRNLLPPYEPALIPLLYGVEFRERLSATVERAAHAAGSGEGQYRPPRRQRRLRLPTRYAIAASAAAAAAVLLGVVIAPHIAHHGNTAAQLGSGHGPVSPGWSIDRGVDGQGNLVSISCASPAACIAVGNDIDIYAAGRWHAGGLSPTNESLTAVSCTRPEFCMFVGMGGQAATASGSDITDLDGLVNINAVSCASAHFCAAVDDAGQALTFDGTSWSQPHQLGTGGRATAISCPSASFCLAEDAAGDLFTYDGTTWSRQPPLAGGAYVQLSCPEARFCVALAPGGAAFTYNGTRWSTVQPAPEPGAGGSWYRLSCASPAFCMAVTASSPAGASEFDGRRWSPLTQLPGLGAMRAISCPQAGYCVGVTDIGDVLTFRRAT